MFENELQEFAYQLEISEITLNYINIIQI